jgi:hypothetical protein
LFLYAKELFAAAKVGAVSAATVEVPQLRRDRVRSFLWTTASYDLRATFGADVVSLKLMKGFAMP